jgi:AraC-like DNA-binding protein
MSEQDAQPGKRGGHDAAHAGTAPSPHVGRISTSNIDEFHAFLSARYNDHKRKVRARRQGFEFSVEQGALGNLTFADADYKAATVELTMPPVSYVAVSRRLRGRYQVQWLGGEVRIASQGAMLIPSEGYTFLIDEGHHHSVTLTTETVVRVAEEITGLDQADVRFAGLSPISPSAARQWFYTSEYIRRGIYTRDLATPLMIAAAEHLVATMMLAIFPNTTMTIEVRAPRDSATAATIRRAIAFIDEHASESITVTDIAAAAGVVPRTLQYAFRRHRNTTPMAYLRQVRLAMAHEELLAAQTGDATIIAAVAARWGFRPKRFADAYRQIYGLTPSQTRRT